MATSSPAKSAFAGSVLHQAAGHPGRSRLAVLNAASAGMLRLMPRIPDSVKKLLLGGKTITIDGNTLDTTLQFMLTLQKSSGVSGLVASSDVGVARVQLRKLARVVTADIAVGVKDLTVTGAAGPLRARH
ncbi:MAG: acetyl esterase [Mycobacterium sp.]|nr:acetyl esterase [Mycobacterium sp.]